MLPLKAPLSFVSAGQLTDHPPAASVTSSSPVPVPVPVPTANIAPWATADSFTARMLGKMGVSAASAPVAASMKTDHAGIGFAAETSASVLGKRKVWGGGGMKDSIFRGAMSCPLFFSTSASSCVLVVVFVGRMLPFVSAGRSCCGCVAVQTLTPTRGHPPTDCPDASRPLVRPRPRVSASGGCDALWQCGIRSRGERHFFTLLHQCGRIAARTGPYHIANRCHSV
jgi:hypothetical protein